MAAARTTEATDIFVWVQVNLRRSAGLEADYPWFDCILGRVCLSAAISTIRRDGSVLRLRQ